MGTVSVCYVDNCSLYSLLVLQKSRPSVFISQAQASCSSFCTQQMATIHRLLSGEWDAAFMLLVAYMLSRTKMNMHPVWNSREMGHQDTLDHWLVFPVVSFILLYDLPNSPVILSILPLLVTQQNSCPCCVTKSHRPRISSTTIKKINVLMKNEVSGTKSE